MATLTYHRKPNGTTYVYRQESYWDRAKKRSATRQVCIGKLAQDGKSVVYNKRFSDKEARDALERGEVVAESVTTGQSLVLKKATDGTGLDRVLYRCFDSDVADVLLSLAWAVVALDAKMYHAGAWIEQSQCAAHLTPPSSQDISRLLTSLGQSDIDSFLVSWMGHRDKGVREQYCFDVTSVSSHNKRNNPFVEYGHNRDGERLAQINIALMTAVSSHMPTYYEVLPGSLSDVKTVEGLCTRMKDMGTGRMGMLLDRGFYSAANIEALLGARIGFFMPVPATVKWAQELIGKVREDIESPENIISINEGGTGAIYATTSLSKMSGRRVWRHVYYDTARRSEHILAFFEKLDALEEELVSGNEIKGHGADYKRYFTVKDTPKRGRRVVRNKKAIDAYRAGRAGYWVIVTNCEKDAAKALFAYRERALVESQFDDMKNDLDMERLRTHGPDTMRGRVFVQFLALVLCAQIRTMLDDAWAKRADVPKDVRLSRRYPLSEMMLRLGSFRQTSFSGKHSNVVSAPTKAQREIFTAFGIDWR
jgi:transposase